MEEIELELEEHCNGEEKFFSALINSIGENEGTFDAGSGSMTTDKDGNADAPTIINQVYGKEQVMEDVATEADNVNQNNQCVITDFLAVVNGRRIGPVKKVQVFLLPLRFDIKVYGTTKLEKKNLVAFCYQKQVRQQRYSKFVDEILKKRFAYACNESCNPCPVFTVEVP